MPTPCFTHILHHVRACVIPGQHIEGLADPHHVQRFDLEEGTYVDTERLCTGCLPWKAIDGLLVCASCLARFEAALTALPALVKHLRSISRAVQPDNAGVRSGTGWVIIIPGPWQAADDLLQRLGADRLPAGATPEVAEKLARRAASRMHAQSRVTLEAGAEMAIRFARAVEAAALAYPTSERASRIRSSRCPACARRSLVYEPAPYAGAAAAVRCLSPDCNHEMDHTHFERLALIEAQCCRRCRTHDRCANPECTCHSFAPVPEWQQTSKPTEEEAFDPNRAEHAALDPLTLLTVPELRKRAEQLEIAQFKQLRKPELVAAIRDVIGEEVRYSPAVGIEPPAPVVLAAPDARYVSIDGTFVEAIDTTGMGWPMRCKHCGQVHDAMAVEVQQRYTDCSVWKCPNCGVVGDDRPLPWGGSFERVESPARGQ